MILKFLTNAEIGQIKKLPAEIYTKAKPLHNKVVYLLARRITILTAGIHVSISRIKIFNQRRQRANYKVMQRFLLEVKLQAAGNRVCNIVFFYSQIVI